MTIQSTACGVKILAPEHVHEKMAGAGLSEKSLRICHLGGPLLMEVAAESEWTLERVLAILDSARACEVVKDAYGGDAYIGTDWIGSTEL